jgi:hypothetical protein
MPRLTSALQATAISGCPPVTRRMVGPQGQDGGARQTQLMGVDEMFTIRGETLALSAKSSCP